MAALMLFSLYTYFHYIRIFILGLFFILMFSGLVRLL